MLKDNRGQVSLEYMLILAISLIILIVFTLPLADLAIKNTLDVSDSLDMKADLLDVAQGIERVYGQGQGARQTVVFDSPCDAKLDVTDSYVSCSLKLKDNSRKLVKVNCNSNIEKTSVYVDEGRNVIVVEWPEGDENMIIY